MTRNDLHTRLIQLCDVSDQHRKAQGLYSHAKNMYPQGPKLELYKILQDEAKANLDKEITGLLHDLIIPNSLHT